MSTETEKKPQAGLNHLLNTSIRMKFTGGRSVEGILRGWDVFTNLLLDDAVETVPSFENPLIPGETRKLGRVVCRAIASCAIFAVEDMVEIPNPFLQDEE